MRLMYNNELVGTITTNNSMSVDDAIESLQVDIENFDDYELFTIDFADEKLNELIKKYANEIITLEELEEMEENELVENVESNGMSGKYFGCKWYTVTLNGTYITNNCDDSSEFDIYVK